MEKANTPYPELTPLERAIFEIYRRGGVDQLNDQEIDHDGDKYHVIANTVYTQKLTEVVLTKLDATGYKRAMAFLGIKNHSTSPFERGDKHLMAALSDGIRIPQTSGSRLHSWRVLPWVEVPAAYAEKNNNE
jgi:hypothetical protein